MFFSLLQLEQAGAEKDGVYAMFRISCGLSTLRSERLREVTRGRHQLAGFDDLVNEPHIEKLTSLVVAADDHSLFRAPGSDSRRHRHGRRSGERDAQIDFR